MAIHKHKNKIETEQVYLHGPNSVDMDLSSICHKRPKTVGSPKSRRYKSVSLAVAVRVYLLTPQRYSCSPQLFGPAQAQHSLVAFVPVLARLEPGQGRHSLTPGGTARPGKKI